jgi:hypothetical protein
MWSKRIRKEREREKKKEERLLSSPPFPHSSPGSALTAVINPLNVVKGSGRIGSAIAEGVKAVA